LTGHTPCPRVLERLSAGFGEVGADVAVPANEGKVPLEPLFTARMRKRAKSVTRVTSKIRSGP